MLGGHRWDSGDRDDACRCKEGILQMRLKSGRLVKRKYESSPFGGSVKTDVETQDERDWNSYVADQRELRDDPEYDPIRFDDGSGASSLSPRARGGGA